MPVAELLKKLILAADEVHLNITLMTDRLLEASTCNVNCLETYE